MANQRQTETTGFVLGNQTAAGVLWRVFTVQCTEFNSMGYFILIANTSSRS